MRPSLLTTAAVILLFLAALLASFRLAGTSPIVWIDTFNDEHEVQQCLIDDSCTLTGMSTSVPGQAHGVAWLELRTLGAWLGLDLDGAHRAIQVGNAVAVVVVFSLATRLGGPIAGVLAGWLAMDGLDSFARATALYNTSPMLFFGAVLLLACAAVVARPGIVSVALAALVAAVMTNVHLSCAMTGVSVVWVALLAPGRRLLLALFGGALFGLATFAMAPPTWMHNLHSLMEDRAARGHLVTLDVPPNPLAGWALFAIASWLASLAIRSPAGALFRRRMQGPLAVIVPSLAVFLIAPRFGFNPEAKYIYHLKAAAAVAVAVPIASVAHAILRTLLAPPRTVWLAPLPAVVLAAALVLPGPFALRARVRAVDERMATVSDVAAVAHVLRDELGWDRARIIERTKTPYGIPFVTGLQQRVGAAGGSADATADPASVALLVMVDEEHVPAPLPASWRVLRRGAQAATVLVVTRSRIDWRSLLICVEPADGSARECEESEWNPGAMGAALLPRMPPGGAWRGTLELWLPLRAEADAPETHVAMPRMPLLCGGRVVSPSDGAITVAPSQRFAAVAAGGGEATEPPLLKLAWDIGGPECEVLAYDGLPPFFIEGDPENVRLLGELLGEDVGSRGGTRAVVSVPGRVGRDSSGHDGACPSISPWYAPATAQAQSAPAERPALMDRVLDRIDQSLLHRCLTPEAGSAMNDLVASGALAPVLGDDLVLARGAVRGDQIQLGFQDRQSRPLELTLALPGAKSGEPDGRGRHFLYYLSAPADLTPGVRSKMLAAAALFDGAIPDSALQRCAGGEAPKVDPRYPRSIALGSAVVELMIVLVAVVFGLRATRHPA